MLCVGAKNFVYFVLKVVVYLEIVCTFAPRKRGRLVLESGGRKVHVHVVLGWRKKERIFFFEKSCQVKKQLYICSRLGKHLRETRQRNREIGCQVDRSSLKYCGDKNRVQVRTWMRGTRIKETYNLVYRKVYIRN